MEAPVLILAIAVVAAVAAWWLRAAIAKGKIDGLEAQLGVLNERLKLAQDKEAASTLRKRFQAAL